MKKTVRKFKETIEIKSSVLTRLKSHRYLTMSLLSLAILLVSCFHVWQRVMVLDLVQEVGQLRDDHDRLEDNLKKVGAEISALSMSSRIERYAVDSLGMKPIKAEQLYTLVPHETESTRPDELTVMARAIKRVADYMPVITEADVHARELQIVTVDTSSSGGEK
ncbi:MAG: cell division protein FtsL [bacterium]|nr:cell division protein FtsL [bacterium]